MKQDGRLDAIDRKILGELQRDGAISHAELADRVGASGASCWRRIRALEAGGVLTRTVRLVSPASVGRDVNVLCNVRLRSHSPQDTAAFETFVERSPEVVDCFSMSGDWDYLMRVVVANVADYNVFLMQRLLPHEAVAGASSHFALTTIKNTTELPV